MEAPKLFDTFFSGLSREPAAPRAGAPLVVAIHGGTFTSRYFDIPGHSLLTRAATAGMRIIAPDRNGYGSSPSLPEAEATIADSARSLAVWLGEAWRRVGGDSPGMVLIGHSIGGAVAAHVAADPVGLPILGMAISGIGLRMPQRENSGPDALPDSNFITMPLERKDGLMFGPPGSFDVKTMPDASYSANAPSPRAEILDVSTGWPRRAHRILEAIRIPVHYRQGACDQLWVVTDEEIEEFAQALVNAPLVDAAMIAGAGHCMDLHRAGADLHSQQLDFALRCVA